MIEIEQIKNRVAELEKLEEKLMKAGPATASAIIYKQTLIQEYYYADAKELLETMDNIVYQLQQLEPLLEMPDKGYVRNGFNRIMETLKEGI